LDYKWSWDEDRVYFHDEKGQLCRIPASWTDVEPVDPFKMISSGRSLFRSQDLLSLAQIIEELTANGRKGNNAASVKDNTPPARRGTGRQSKRGRPKTKKKKGKGKNGA
jgi:hypothetical protein